ncbi:hypothetical protein GCM10007108_01460 [Thermogymnomonas acidicola]|uniref:Rubrerythrin diiron-binding domain-containing protein n=1 Tax=Thermogymnomonas acidicola TaxID=399579 RepID=A0AA37F8N1_9ARCH|nr:VIT1/CCC1 family protein [Thermogymnomonas acidicola]GGM67122.1 hypothetical protein GCM10007108_01460 [Thermogymnomonas acidicola]
MKGQATAAYEEFYRDEITDMEFYRKLSGTMKGTDLGDSLARLSDVEREHSDFWRKAIESSGESVSHIRPRYGKISLLLFLRRILGTVLTVRMLEHGEISTVKMYREYADSLPDGDPMRQGLEKIIREEVSHEEIFQNSIERTRKDVQRSRDIIYGMSDGLVEVLAALAGLSAIIVDHFIIALGGLVVGIGGTISMTVGAYLSQSTESQYRINEEMKKSLFRMDGRAESKIASIEGESAESALTVAYSYIIGALVPIVPFLLLPRIPALAVSVVLVAVAEALSNSIVSLSMGLSIGRNAIKATALSLIASAATYTVGELFHIFLHITVL